MNKEEIRKHLANCHTEDSLKALQHVCLDFKKSDHYAFIEELKQHLITKELRAGGSDLVAYGRVQGINTVFDLIDFISTAEFKKPEVETKEEPLEVFEYPAGYGAI